MKILVICGARPNFMKIAPLMRAFARHPELQPVLVHTGQHYDARMSALFFEELDIPAPEIHLEVGSGSHARQTALLLERFEPVLLAQRPDAVLVVGDVNSTLACALVAAKLGVRVFHVEAGLRSFDRSMPEEINRVLTDAISDLLFVSEPSGLDNLRREGVDPAKIHFVGNVMIDTLERSRARAAASTVLDTLGLRPGGYALVTLHRPASVDDPTVLGSLLDIFGDIQRDLPVVFPVHPRTRHAMQASGWLARLDALPGLRLIEPQGYLDFLRLMSEARVVFTDSGGVQEETTILGVPCLTLRENTERPVTVTQGTNRLVGLDPRAILSAYHALPPRVPTAPPRPEKWDGHAAERIATILAAQPA